MRSSLLIFGPLTLMLGAFIYGTNLHPSSHSSKIKAVEKDLSFRKEVIYDTFISEGVASADVNNDGQVDILAGHYWFEAPSWSPHEIRTPETFDYTTGYSHSFLNFTIDVNQDGWMDFICFDFPGDGVYWYENPKGVDQHWVEHLIDSMASNESPMFTDLDDDGNMDLVFGHQDSGEMMWYSAPKNKNDLTWTKHIISEKKSPGTDQYSHGLGAGDVNGDGRKDILVDQGWYEAPANRTTSKWMFHADFTSEPYSQMYTFDFDKDGDNDILSSSAHAYGIWWHEQRTVNGETKFIRHLIDTSFSQTHGMAFTDLTGDGANEFITGKRYFAHQGKDPGGLEDPVLYWFALDKNAGSSPTWTRHLVSKDSGAGLQVVIKDINGDGKLDILNANKKGVVCYFQE